MEHAGPCVAVDVVVAGALAAVEEDAAATAAVVVASVGWLGDGQSADTGLVGERADSYSQQHWGCISKDWAYRRSHSAGAAAWHGAAERYSR